MSLCKSEQAASRRGRLIRLTGELQNATVSTARRAIWPELQQPGPLIVDLEGVSFIDSAGLGFLLTAHREVARRGGRWALVGASATVARMLAMTQADRLLPLFPSLVDVEQAWSEEDGGAAGGSGGQALDLTEPLHAIQRLIL